MQHAGSVLGRELFIYWKVAAAQLQLALQATQALQNSLRQHHPGLLARVLQRADESGAGNATLMEIYALPEGLGPDVQQAIEVQAALHLAPLGAPLPQRHVEVFQAR